MEETVQRLITLNIWTITVCGIILILTMLLIFKTIKDSKEPDDFPEQKPIKLNNLTFLKGGKNNGSGKEL